MITGVQLRVLCSTLLYRRILILNFNHEMRRNLRFIVEQQSLINLLRKKDAFRYLFGCMKKNPFSDVCLEGSYSKKLRI